MASERTQLITAIDRYFSLYIRMRDCPDGVGYCCTCGKACTVSSVDAGHFVPRGVMLTRWDPRNVHAQCRGCNHYKSGDLAEYLVFLEGKYGREVVDELLELKRQWRTGANKSFSLAELREMRAKWWDACKINNS